MRLQAAFVVAFALIYSSLTHAELVLSSAPRETTAEGQKMYGPLAERLSAALGEPVVYEHPLNWAEYSDKIRHDQYDILLDGPHLTSWRIKHIGHIPVARLPGYLEFKFVSIKGNKHFSDDRSIKHARVCVFATPNMTAVVLLDRYRNEVAVPKLVQMKGKMSNILDGLMNRKCDVAVLRDQFYDKKMSDEQRAQVKVIAESKKYPNQGISTSRRVTEAQRQKILEVMQNDPSIKPILARFARKAKGFIPSDINEYESASGMLEGVVWGW